MISRVVAPSSKLSTLAWQADTTLGADLDVAGASTDGIYAAMDWLAGRQDAIEAKLAARHLAPEANRPGWRCLTCPARGWRAGAARWPPAATPGTARRASCRSSTGCSPTPKAGPVAVRVLPGSTGDLAAFTQIVQVVREKFRLEKMVMAGDRGMITSARIAALNQLEDGTARPDGYGWITALRAPAIRKLMAGGGPLQMSLFDEQNLAEITSDDFPGERLIACRNPVLAADRARTRDELLAATEKLLAPIITRVQAGKLTGAGKIGVAAGKVISRYRTGKHFDLTITAYKNLKYVERDFRHLKADDLDLRPVYHHLEERVKAHVLICMLGCYLAWHLRRAWAPLTFTDENPPAGGPVAPARRSPQAQAKASRQHDQAGRPYRSFSGLLAHLATLTRNQVRSAGATATVPMLAEPTSHQREAFDLIGAPIPLTLK